MKLTLVVPGGVAEEGGAEELPVLRWLVERLSQRHVVTVLSMHQYAEPRTYSWRGAKVHALAGGRAPGRHGSSPARDRSHPLSGSRPRLRPHLPGLRLLTAAHEANRIVESAGGCDVVHAFWAGATGVLAGLVGLRRRVPVVVSLAGGELTALPEIGYGGRLHLRDRLNAALALRLASRVTAGSRFAADLARSRGTAARIVPLGVDRGWTEIGGRPTSVARREADLPWTPRRTDVHTDSDGLAGDGGSTSRSALRKSGRRDRLLFVGNLNRVKDPLLAIEALAILRAEGLDVELALVGPDHMSGAAQEHAARAGVADRARFVGRVEHDQLPPYYRSADLVCCPSRFDAAPVVALEAAMLGAALVGTRVGHLADLAELQPPAASAVPPGDARALAAAIARLLAYPELRREQADAARAWAYRYDADWTAAAFEREYGLLASNLHRGLAAGQHCSAAHAGTAPAAGRATRREERDR